MIIHGSCGGRLSARARLVIDTARRFRITVVPQSAARSFAPE
jgi:hypothetical protein